VLLLPHPAAAGGTTPRRRWSDTAVRSVRVTATGGHPVSVTACINQLWT